MDELRGRKYQVMEQLREAAWNTAAEAREMRVPIPASALMVLRASDHDFLVAQHRGPASPDTVASEIETMQKELDAAALQKLATIALRADTHLGQVS